MKYHCRSCEICNHQFIIMSHVPAEETKVLYPSMSPDEPQQPGGYYPQQAPAGSTAAPGQRAVTYCPPTGPPQQHPQQLVIAQGAPIIVEPNQPRQSFIGHIVFSCCVTWCCAWPCGLPAFILASKWKRYIYHVCEIHTLCPIQTSDANATQLSSWVASATAVWHNNRN